MPEASGSKGLVYLAGAAYTPEEMQGLEVLAGHLVRAGWDVYLPVSEGLEQQLLTPAAAPRGNHLLFFREVLERAAFALEIYQIVERCDALVFSLNGRVPDEGGVFKAAVAFAAGKPLVLYKRDHRSKLHGNDNAMVSGLSPSFSSVRKAKALPKKLDDAVARAAGYNGAPYAKAAIPPLVRQLAGQGRQVQDLLGRRPAASDFYEELAQIMTTSTLTQDWGQVPILS